MSAAALVVLATLVSAAPTPPSPTRWVEDRAGLMSPAARDALDARLEAYEHASGHQVVVWIGHTLGGAPLDDWAVRTFAAWKLGRSGFDDGLAVFVLADDRLIDIEVGYGLEAVVPDAIASRVIRDVMAPRLRAGDRDGAVTAGVDALLAAIEGGPWIAPGGTTGTTTEPPLDKPTTAEIIVYALLALGVLAFLIKHPRLAFGLLWMIGRRGGGGFGGGGRGGFGGGGGGRSGGGGARGGW